MAGCTILGIFRTIEAYVYEMREKVRKVMTGFPDLGSLPIAGQLMHEEFDHPIYPAKDPTKPQLFKYQMEPDCTSNTK
jgi:hypothetical protein